jgi:hypothetical protein
MYTVFSIVFYLLRNTIKGLVVLKRLESFSNMVQSAQILNSFAPLVKPFTDYSFMEYLGDYWNSDMSFALNTLLNQKNSCLKKQKDLKEFTTHIQSKKDNYNAQSFHLR